MSGVFCVEQFQTISGILNGCIGQFVYTKYMLPYLTTTGGEIGQRVKTILNTNYIVRTVLIKHTQKSLKVFILSKSIKCTIVICQK